MAERYASDIDPPSRLFESGSQRVEYFKTSETCHLPAVEWNREFLDEVRSKGGDVSEDARGTYNLTAICFPRTVPSSLSTSLGKSTDILEAILSEVVGDGRRHSLSCSVNGIVGGLNSQLLRAKRSIDILPALSQRFLGRERLSPLTQHSRWPEFLRAKATELAQRRSVGPKR